MFDLAAARLVWIPVRWKGARQGEDGQAVNCVHEIECQVELVDTDRMKEIFGVGADGAPEEGSETLQQAPKPKLSEIEKFKALCRNWRGVASEGHAVDMTDENIQRILKIPMFPAGFERCYLDAWTGQMETREKNSEGSPTPGRADGASGAEKKTGK